MVFLHEHLFVDLFGRNAAWRPGDAEQTLCFDSDEAGSTYSARGPHAHISGARHVTNSISLFRVVTRLARHNVVAPLLAAPLLTDFRRSTVGQVRVRTCADRSACVVGGVRPALQASTSCRLLIKG